MISNISSISKMSLVLFDCIWRGSHIEVVQRDNGMVYPVGIYNTRCMPEFVTNAEMLVLSMNSLTKELLFVAFGYFSSLYRPDLERAKNAYKKGDFL
jgi:hypothetical protein